jgi:hypothetical protein
MRHPDWFSSLPFKVVCEKGMTKDYLKRYKPTLLTMARVVTDNKIFLRLVRLHYHADAPCKNAGYAEDWIHKITLCSADLDTMLHELAHVATKSDHSKRWAKYLFRLHKKYMSPSQCRRLDLWTAREYPVAVRYYKRRYKREPSPLIKRKRKETPDV